MDRFIYLPHTAFSIYLYDRFGDVCFLYRISIYTDAFLIHKVACADTADPPENGNRQNVTETGLLIMWSCWPSALLYMQKNCPFSADTDGWSQISHFSTYFSGNPTFLLLIFPEFTDGWPQFFHFSTYFSGNLTFLLILFPEFTDGWLQISHFSTYFSGNPTFLLLIFPEFTDGWPQFLHFSTYFAGNPAYHLPLITLMTLITFFRLSASGYRDTASLWASTHLLVLIPDYRQRIVTDTSPHPYDWPLRAEFS